MEEIRLNIETFIGSNVDTIYRNTGSLEVNKYVKLIIQIAKKRIETKHTTGIDWNFKTIKVKEKLLTDKQLKASYWVLEHREEVKNKVYSILERYLKRHRQPDKLIKKLETKKKIDNKTIF